MALPITLSNPRITAVIPNWPLGGNKRGICIFRVERDAKRGYRISRTTTGKPKFTTYGGKAAIVDGSDGRTYLIQVAGSYGFIKISRSDFMDANTTFPKCAISPGDDGYETLNALIEQANRPVSAAEVMGQ